MYDLTHITCLIKKDGIEYEFIHESIAQYFSALFVKGQGEENAKKFYESRIGDWVKFEGEFVFLRVIDKVRFNRYFYVPSLQSLLVKDVGPVKRAVIDSVYAKAIIVSRASDDNSEIDNIVRVFAPYPTDYVIRLALNERSVEHVMYSHTSEVAESYIKRIFGQNNKNREKLSVILKNNSKAVGPFLLCDLGKFLTEARLKDNFISVVEPALFKFITKEIGAATEIIDMEKQKEGLFE